MLRDLSKFLKVDTEKETLIQDLIFQSDLLQSKKNTGLVLRSPSFDRYLEPDAEYMPVYNMGDELPATKFCPKCHEKYPEEENVCYDCLVALKPLSDKVAVADIVSKPVFKFEGENSLNDFTSIFNESNIQKVMDFDFNKRDLNQIIRNIKRTSLTNLDGMIKENYVDLDDITTLEKVLLFAKSFVNVEYKSYGQQLGYFEFDTITIDDRQSNSLQMTTLIHELAHFILKEIIEGVVCRLLDCDSSRLTDVIATYILSYSNFTQLIDEYSAHCCEGRFTVYGYQDYSSFLDIVSRMDGEMSREEIEITKAIGNTFANVVKDILEIYIDRDILGDMKQEFLRYHIEDPNYEMLRLENCEMLTDEGFMKSIWLVVSDGFAAASKSIDTLNSYLEEAKQ